MTARSRHGAPPLRRLQQWLAVVMRHPDTAATAVRARAARTLFAPADVLAGAIVRPNDRMSVTDRLQVYNGSYLARLEEVLASDFGALRHLLGHLLGHDAWHRLCARYVDRHPSRHPNLNQFGRRLPEFVRTQRSLPRHAFACELARLENAIAESFDAAAFTPLAATALGAIAAADWPRARLVANPSLRLLALAYPANAYYRAFKDDEQPAPPRRRRTFVAVFRRDFRVYRLELEPAAFAVLTALQQGQPLGRALRHAAGGDVGAWFRTWSGDGLFTEVRTGPAARRGSAPRRARKRRTPA